MASNSSRNEHPYDNRLRYWKDESSIAPHELSDALMIEWFSLPYSAETEKYHNPPLRKAMRGATPKLQCYIPNHLRELVRFVVRILALYQHLAARVPWIDMRAKASANNQPTLAAWVHQMYSGLRLNAYVAQQVLGGVVDKVKAITIAEGLRDSSTAAPYRRFPLSSHIPELIQFLFEQVAFGTSCPETIDLPDPVFRIGENDCRYFPDPIIRKWSHHVCTTLLICLN